MLLYAENNTYPQWQSGTVYHSGDTVLYNEGLFLCNSQIWYQPPTTTYWTYLYNADGNFPQYDNEQYYKQNTIVRYNSKFYRAISDIYGWLPTTAYWELVSGNEKALQIVNSGGGKIDVRNTPNGRQIKLQNSNTFYFPEQQTVLLRYWADLGKTFLRWQVKRDGVIINSDNFNNPTIELVLDATYEVIPIAETVSISKDSAIAIATSHIQEWASSSNDDLWTDNTFVLEAYPIYIDGIDGISYYECKVVLGDLDAGYILVNVNQTDLLIAEYSMDGITDTERFTQGASRSVEDMKIYRYNWFEMAAEVVGDGSSRGRLLAVRGFDGTGEIKLFPDGSRSDEMNRVDSLRGKLREKNSAAGCASYVSKERIFSHYNKPAQYNAFAADSLGVNEARYIDTAVTGRTHESRWTGDELNGVHPSGWHLPNWDQVYVDIDGVLCPTGCAPLALTMCYVYHHWFNHKVHLWSRFTSYYAASDHPLILSKTLAIGKDVNAYYSSSNTIVYLDDMDGSDAFGDRVGYNCKTDYDEKSDWNKGMDGLEKIKKEEPFIVLFDSDYTGSGDEIVDHYAAVEAVKYQEKKYKILWWWSSWKNDQMWYLVNFGYHKSKRAWICVDDNYKNNVKVELSNTYNVYLWFE